MLTQYHGKYSNNYNRVTKILTYNYVNNGPSIRILLIVISSPFVSYSLINLYFLLSQTEYFDKSIILPFLVFTAFGFLL